MQAVLTKERSRCSALATSVEGSTFTSFWFAQRSGQRLLSRAAQFFPRRQAEFVVAALIMSLIAESSTRVLGTVHVSGQSKPATSIAGKNVGRKSQCELLAEAIIAKVEVGLSAQQIYPGFDGGKWLHRFLSIRKALCAQAAINLTRAGLVPGTSAGGRNFKLDFGLGAPIDDAQGKTRRSWVMRLVLSYSRKATAKRLVVGQDRDS